MQWSIFSFKIIFAISDLTNSGFTLAHIYLNWPYSIIVYNVSLEKETSIIEAVLWTNKKIPPEMWTSQCSAHSVGMIWGFGDVEFSVQNNCLANVLSCEEKWEYQPTLVWKLN